MKAARPSWQSLLEDLAGITDEDLREYLSRQIALAKRLWATQTAPAANAGPRYASISDITTTRRWFYQPPEGEGRRVILPSDTEWLGWRRDTDQGTETLAWHPDVFRPRWISTVTQTICVSEPEHIDYGSGMVRRKADLLAAVPRSVRTQKKDHYAFIAYDGSNFTANGHGIRIPTRTLRNVLNVLGDRIEVRYRSSWECLYLHLCDGRHIYQITKT